MVLSDVMDQLATQLEAINGLRVTAYPADHVNPPAAIVGYPESWEFDTTYQRGSDMAVLPVWIVVSNAYSRSARDQLATLIGPVKETLDSVPGAAPDAYSTACSQTIEFDVISVGGQDLLSALFRVTAYS
ncbi:hypothetical protein [Actinospongicola halichondriae]|uniref:hypothetical protein n=1 Tax=Actinospongicola halichondriae TaxID=3236844 RepID=UPI003D45DD62